MAPVFPFRYTTYGAGFSTAHDPSFPISDRTDGLLAFLTPFQRLKTELNRKNAAQIDGRPFLVQWFLPIPRWGKTLKKTVEDDMRSLVHPAPLLNLSLYSVSRRTIDHPQSDIVIVAQAVTEEARPNHSQLRSRVYPKILSLLSSPEVGRPEIGCYVEYTIDPRRLLNPLGILPPKEPEEDLTRTPDFSGSGSSSLSNSRPSSPITAPLDSDGPQPPEGEDEKTKEEADPVSEFFDIDAYDASNSPGGPSAES
ncbi:hypothetical protein CGCF415_v005637 [Colletotrichum fructicola]|uniref:Uncharacterized protein n=1 Tax=Colletotrichum fructicola (strain Nara gc5) TaxID=1213859 RepID=L2GB62_COLFN|nr:uncharacterized protein CGMCC3_g10723 [Colletotrichum fructicola]KAF4491211.1 hypothetical protein CGGC5_v000800 [Colletotrichum fructicola Nara gc5]KAE9573188.1 hypothetical protein CGMCC3_g10723 [Colletotrichum fructicola]KAF4423344.1 hypothetical protein CFRS1_v004633 [Colletotrichum fructicola]KAF4892360.1 hypothetical protein CGCFRS4_v007653 [Colletotrichum fructicola]KAF4909842.1 hypothetical protein CGCF415_v005637 [Colletotrichum fructicola]